MTSKIRTCIVNPTHHYEYCPRCKQYASEPTWKLEFCSEECKNLYTIVNKFNFGHMTLEEAREALSAIDLSDYDNLRFDIKAVVDRILPVAEPEIKDEEIISEPKPSVKKRKQ